MPDERQRHGHSLINPSPDVRIQIQNFLIEQHELNIKFAQVFFIKPPKASYDPIFFPQKLILYSRQKFLLKFVQFRVITGVNLS